VKYYRDEDALKSADENLRRIRLSKNISQDDLALECSLKYSQINRIELGKNTSISQIYLIVSALKVHAKELIS